MRKIINSTYISLDGVIEAPHTWPSTGPDDENAVTIQTELLQACDALLMGRRTYRDCPHAVFDLRDVTTLRSGTVILSYAAAS